MSAVQQSDSVSVIPIDTYFLNIRFRDGLSQDIEVALYALQWDLAVYPFYM